MKERTGTHSMSNWWSGVFRLCWNHGLKFRV